MNTKSFILYVSLIINLIFAYWVFNLNKHDQESNAKLFKSKGRVELLERKLSKQDSSLVILEGKNDSISKLIANQKDKIDTIKKKYNEKADNIINVSTDSSISILSRRLSEINLD